MKNKQDAYFAGIEKFKANFKKYNSDFLKNKLRNQSTVLFKEAVLAIKEILKERDEL